MLEKLKQINKQIDECHISELKKLSNQKNNLLKQIIMKIKEAYPETKQSKVEIIKDQINLIDWVIKEVWYVNAMELKELEAIKRDLQNKLRVLSM